MTLVALEALKFTSGAIAEVAGAGQGGGWGPPGWGASMYMTRGRPEPLLDKDAALDIAKSLIQRTGSEVYRGPGWSATARPAATWP